MLCSTSVVLLLLALLLLSGILPSLAPAHKGQRPVSFMHGGMPEPLFIEDGQGTVSSDHMTEHRSQTMPFPTTFGLRRMQQDRAHGLGSTGTAPQPKPLPAPSSLAAAWDPVPSSPPVYSSPAPVPSAPSPSEPLPPSSFSISSPSIPPLPVIPPPPFPRLLPPSPLLPFPPNPSPPPGTPPPSTGCSGCIRGVLHITFAADFAVLSDKSKQISFRSEMASAVSRLAGVPKDNILATELRSGSIIVDVVLLFPSLAFAREYQRSIDANPVLVVGPSLASQYGGVVMAGLDIDGYASRPSPPSPQQQQGLATSSSAGTATMPATTLAVVVVAAIVLAAIAVGTFVVVARRRWGRGSCEQRLVDPSTPSTSTTMDRRPVAHYRGKPVPLPTRMVISQAVIDPHLNWPPQEGPGPVQWYEPPDALSAPVPQPPVPPFQPPSGSSEGRSSVEDWMSAALPLAPGAGVGHRAAPPAVHMATISTQPRIPAPLSAPTRWWPMQAFELLMPATRPASAPLAQPPEPVQDVYHSNAISRLAAVQRRLPDEPGPGGIASASAAEMYNTSVSRHFMQPMGSSAALSQGELHGVEEGSRWPARSQLPGAAEVSQEPASSSTGPAKSHVEIFVPDRTPRPSLEGDNASRLTALHMTEVA